MKNLSGLVICGGKSTRMGTDKSLLEYHGVPQRDYMFHLLTRFCSKVYLSLNHSQAENYCGLNPFIMDNVLYKGIGPMCALLSAWKEFPDSSWLVAGCDYPLVTDRHLQKLVSYRSGNATCFFLKSANVCEPLLAIYESGFYVNVLESFNKGNYSLSKLLKLHSVNRVDFDNESELRSVNTVEEYDSLRLFIKQRKEKLESNTIIQN